jgi:hypothetical protein
MGGAEALILVSIPLLMGAFCLAYGLFLLSERTADTSIGAELFVSGHVVTFLTAICIALFCTAATIILQLTHRYNDFYRYALPTLGYTAAVVTFVWGLVVLLSDSSAPDHFVAGHVMCGLGLIAACVSTVATASTRFSLIPVNSAAGAGVRQPAAFSSGTARILIAIPVLCAAAGLVWGLTVIATSGPSSHFIAGHVLTGLSLICAALVALVASIARQITNAYQARERRIWPWIVAALGAINLIWGLFLIVDAAKPYWVTPGWVMFGLSMVCFSILSKVTLLALVWRSTFALANRIPLIPVATTLVCLFVAAFLFQDAVTNVNLVVPARVVAGLGAVCFTLFSIVSILESGTGGA